MFVINQYLSGYGTDFAFTVTVGAGGTFTLPFRTGFTYNCTCNWGDGNISTITAYNDADITHTYTNAGDYICRIAGTMGSWRFNNGGDKLKLKRIDNWGNVSIGVNGLQDAFYGCTNLLSVPSGPITGIAATGSLQQIFSNCSSLTSVPVNIFENINSNSLYAAFDTSGITTAPSFANQSNCTTFAYTFRSCTSLTTLQTDQFRYCVNVTTFLAVFQSCTSLVNLVNNMFYYNSLVTNYDSVFYACRNLVLPTTLFNTANLNIVTSFNNFMRATATGYSGTGTIQDIWNYTTATKLNAFTNQTSLANYAAIPNDWKGL